MTTAGWEDSRWHRRAMHFKHWRLLPGGYAREQWRDLAVLARCETSQFNPLHAA